MTLLLIRHGETPGNAEKRYIGRTDEPLSGAGRKKLEELKVSRRIPEPDAVYISPMRRCRESAGILFPGWQPVAVEDLRETDFGLFEGKNYMELNARQELKEAYQQWIDSNGTLPFPHGESRWDFICRTVTAFRSVMEEAFAGESVRTAALVVHGGSIMAVLSSFCGGNYYDYQVSNGEGYVCTVCRCDDGFSISDLRRL